MTTPSGSLTYRIVVRGTKPGHSVDQVVDTLSRLLKKPPPILKLLLDGRKTVFLRTTDTQRATAYRRTLDTIGCVCSIETELPSPVSAEDSSFTVNFATAAIKPAAGREFEFVQPPTLWEMLINYVRANRVTLGVAFALMIYLGYKFFPGRG